VILVDSSAWIDFLAARETAWTRAISTAVTRLDTIVTGDLILAEVLQGMRHDRDVVAARKVFARFPTVDLCGPAIAEKAAANYRALRKRGITIRGTIDVVIATWCIENGAAIIHNDRDMAAMEAHLGLRAYA
jgi:predicted nucleic acid-binding protein